MVTKNDERKALEQIKKIIEKLGEDSYIAIAFEGCFEIAEENIDNDMACSMKQRYEMADKEAWDAQKRHSACSDELTKCIEQNKQLKREIETKDQLLEQERSFKREVKKELEQADREVEKQSDIIEKLNEVIERQDNEILKLKARLYDCICEQ